MGAQTKGGADRSSAGDEQIEKGCCARTESSDPYEKQADGFFLAKSELTCFFRSSPYNSSAVGGSRALSVPPPENDSQSSDD
jgi:hypothetical protein